MIGDYKKFVVDYASLEDVDYLAPRLREQDLAEVHSSHSPHDALMLGLATGELITYGKLFANTLIGDYPYGSNAVWEKNHVSRRWLEHLGAKFEDPIEIDSKTFLPFKLYPTHYV